MVSSKSAALFSTHVGFLLCEQVNPWQILGKKFEKTQSNKEKVFEYKNARRGFFACILVRVDSKTSNIFLRLGLNSE